MQEGKAEGNKKSAAGLVFFTQAYPKADEIVLAFAPKKDPAVQLILVAVPDVEIVAAVPPVPWPDPVFNRRLGRLM